MHIEKLINSIEKRPKMYVKEENIEYIYYYILGYCSASHHFSQNDMDKMFCSWFWKWLVEWIRSNVDPSYQSESVLWYDDIKKIANDRNEEVVLFFKLTKNFFDDYKNNKGYFERNLF